MLSLFFQLQIQKLVNQEVNRQLAALAAASEEEKAQRDRQLQMLLDQEEQRNARLTVVERER